MVSVPERKLFSAPSGGFGVTEREGMGVTEREAPPFSLVSFVDSGGPLAALGGQDGHWRDALFTPSFQDMVEDEEEVLRRGQQEGRERRRQEVRR